MPSRSKTGGTVRGVDPRFPTTLSRANQSRISRYSASAIARKPLSLLRLPLRLACGPNGSLRSSIGTGARNALKGAQGETKKRRGHHAARPKGHHAARPKGHHAARPRGALIETRTRTPTQRRHRVACPRGAMIRSHTPLSDQHPTGTSPDVMASSLGSHAGYDYRPTGTSPVETNTAVRRGRAPSKRTPPQGEPKKRRGHHAARPKGHHSARPRGALIETRTRTPTQRRHHVA